MADKQYLYLLYSESGLYKIGISNDIEKRMKALQGASGFKITCLAYYKTKENARTVEGKLHKLFKKFRVEGEWFDFKGRFVQEKFDTLCERYSMYKMDFDENGRCIPYPKEDKSKKKKYTSFGDIPNTLATENKIYSKREIDYWRKKYGIKTKYPQ